MESSIEDLLDNYRLRATIYPNYTTHPTRTRDLKAKPEIRWDRKEKIGQGNFGQVWRELHCLPGAPPKARAVKVLNKQRMINQVDFKKEILALSKLSKQEYREAEVIVSFLGWYENDENVFLAMEYFEYGDLGRHIMDVSVEDEVRQITIDLLQGLKIMHAEGFTHRDLKPQNVFVVQKPPLSERWWVKIGDFGISKRAPEIQGFIESDNETSEYSNAVDIWSLGCILYNISAHRMPFDKSSDVNKFCQNRLRFPKEALRPVLGLEGISFLERLLVPEPAKRLSVEFALKDPWVLDTSCDTVPAGYFVPEPNRPTGNSEHYRSQPTSTEVRSEFKMQDSFEDKRFFIDQEYQRNKSASITAASNEQAYMHDWPTTSLIRGEPTRDIHHTYKTPLTPLEHEPSPFKYSQPQPPGVRDSGMASELGLDAIMAWRRTSMSQDTPPQLADTNSFSTHQLQPLPSRITRLTSSRPSESVLKFRTVSRSFETEMAFGYAWQYYNIPLRHTEPVYGLTISADGHLLASCSRDSIIRLWNLNTMEPFLTLNEHEGTVMGIAFSPDCKIIASCSVDNTVRLWNISTGKCYHIIACHRDIVRGVAFSPDGRLLASCSNDTTVHVLIASGGDRYLHLLGHSEAVNEVYFSPDGKLIASCSNDRTIRLWDVETGLCRHVMKGHKGAVFDIAFSPDGQFLASCSHDRTVRLWDVTTGQSRHIFSDHIRSIRAVTFSIDGRILASCSEDKTIRLWYMNGYAVFDIIRGHTDTVHCAGFLLEGVLPTSAIYEPFTRYVGQRVNKKSSDRNIDPPSRYLMLASCSSDKTVRIWRRRL